VGNAGSKWLRTPPLWRHGTPWPSAGLDSTLSQCPSRLELREGWVTVQAGWRAVQRYGARHTPARLIITQRRSRNG